MNEESLYWLFSSSAQSVSTFVAFLLAGFAIVLQLMQSSEEKDDTLQQIHQELKNEYHKILVILLILTGASISTSLFMLYLNGLKYSWIGWPSLFVFVLNGTAIIFGIWFVTLIIDPSKYVKTADKMFEEESKSKGVTGGETINRNTFFDSFVELEKELRHYIKSNKLDYNLSDRPRIDYSFRQMVEILNRAEIINRTLYDKLLDINRIRNLVFHGHTQTVSSAFVDLVQNIHIELKDSIKSRKSPIKSLKLTRKSPTRRKTKS